MDKSSVWQMSSPAFKRIYPVRFISFRWKGYIFKIDIARVKEILRKIVGEYDAGDQLEDFLCVLSSPLCPIDFCGKISYKHKGHWCDFIISGIGAYYPDEKSIEISADAILSFERHGRMSRLRTLNSMVKKELFAYVLAHEIRHWIQYHPENQKKNLNFKFETRFFYSLSLFLTFFLKPYGVLIMGTILTFSSILLALFELPGFLPIFLLGIALDLLLMSSIKYKEKFLPLENIIRSIEYFFDPKEIDAHNFGMLAVNKKEWLDLVSIEKA